MVFGEDETMCDVAIRGTHLEQAQFFKYLRCVVNKSGIDYADIVGKVMQVGRYNNDERGLSLECARFLHENMLVPTLVYGNGLLV